MNMKGLFQTPFASWIYFEKLFICSLYLLLSLQLRRGWQSFKSIKSFQAESGWIGKESADS